MVVSITTEPAFRAAQPQQLFEKEYFQYYDVFPDGQHFVMIKNVQKEAPPTELNVVLNWFEELKRLVPTGTN